MQKFFKKIISTFTTLVIVGTNFMPALVYATNEISNSEKVEDVTFDATINGEYSYEANFDEKLELNINLNVENDGYIKNGKITIENNNYLIGDFTSKEDNVTRVDKNTYLVNQVNNSESVNITLPIEFEKSQFVDIDYFNRDSFVKLEATYLDADGEEKIINKTIKENVRWNCDVETNIQLNLKRYLKYDNKTLVSFIVSSGVNDNQVPATEKTIQILVPILNEKEPSKVIVSGNNIDYTYQDQILIVNKKYTNNENKVSWNSNDEFLVTYVYDTQIDETTINTVALMSLKIATNQTIDAKTEETSYFVKDELGNLLETSITGDDSINKGYMYTNLDRSEDKLETPFKSNYQINIGLSEILDEIQVVENPSEKLTINKKISVDGNELVSMLGEEGTIKVLDSQDNELGTLNKDNLQLDVDAFGLKYIISKPVKEGNINITLDKIVNPQLIYTKQSLSKVQELENTIDVIGILQGNEISNNRIIKKFALIEPTPNATITIDRQQLSTVIKNEDVVITATLERNDITDALYENPELLITLPSQIAEVNLKDARLIYEDELVPIDFRAEGRIIYLNMKGKQTKYSSIPTANGTVVRIVADLTLDNLTVNSDETISLQYTNKAIDNKVRTVEAPIKVVAPTGFITANAGTMSQNITAITDNQVFQIAANDREKQINLSGIVVSNLNENATGFMILGRIPTQGTKAPDNSNQDLNTTYTSTINSQINVEGIDADVYYSNNGEATYDLSNESYGWTTDFLTDAKSYMIVAKGEVAPAQKVTFNYNAIIPKNLDYENSATSVFAVYYDNRSEEGITKNIISSKLLSINTENIPVIKTEITATDYNSKDEIKNGDSIATGTIIQYLIRVTNTGKETAKNVKVKVIKPENARFYTKDYILETETYDPHYIDAKDLTFSVEKIEPGETRMYMTVVSTVSALPGNSVIFRTEVSAENMMENSSAYFENEITSFSASLSMFSMNESQEVYLGDEIEYNILLSKLSQDNLNNVYINVEIPKYLELIDYEDGEYNEKTRTLTYYYESLEETITKTIKAKVISSDEPNQSIQIFATIMYDGLDSRLKSDVVSNTIMDTNGFKANVTTNLTSTMLETDTAEYYVNVVNESKRTASINIFDKLPNELYLLSYTVRNGNSESKTYEADSYMVNVSEDLLAGETLKVTIVAKVNPTNGTKDIENNISVKVNGMDLEVNSIKQQIQGAVVTNPVQSENSGTTETQENIYSISGRIWYDENSNSRKETEEIGMPANMLRLYDLTNQTLVKNADGSILEIYTNENGEYKFNNLSKGKYIILANYDNKSYVVANYQDKELEQNEDCDFISSNSKVATTNIITIDEENIYNIDLGLVDINNFNITLTNTITKMSVIDNDKTTVIENIENLSNIKIDNIENSRLVIEYTIKISNEGNIEGYATAVENYIPTGMEFISELNPDWYIDDKGNAVNSSIANKLLLPGEEEEIKLVLIKDMSKSKGQLVHSEARIRNTYNKYGIEEIKTETSLSKIKYGVADIIITKKENIILQVSLISISLLMVIGLIGGVTLRKYNKELKNIETI